MIAIGRLLFAGRGNVVSNIEAACRRVANGDFDEYSAWNSREGATREIQGAPGAGKTSLLRHLESTWRKRDKPNEPVSVPVVIPNHALKGTEAFADAIGNCLPVSLFGKAKGLLERIKGMSVFGTGLSIDWSSPANSENLRFPRKRAVVLMIDEAQNLDLSSPRTPAAEFLLWLHQGNHGMPLLPVLSNLESRLAEAGISGLLVDAVHSLGCLTRDETPHSAALFFDYFGISRSDQRDDSSETLYDLSEGWPAHLHHGFRSLSGVLADADLRHEAVDGGAFRHDEARLRTNYFNARTDMLPVQLIARSLDKVGASGTRDD